MRQRIVVQLQQPERRVGPHLGVRHTSSSSERLTLRRAVPNFSPDRPAGDRVPDDRYGAI
jgi:hypothetical protein